MAAPDPGGYRDTVLGAACTVPLAGHCGERQHQTRCPAHACCALREAELASATTEPRTSVPCLEDPCGADGIALSAGHEDGHFLLLARADVGPDLAEQVFPHVHLDYHTSRAPARPPASCTSLPPFSNACHRTSATSAAAPSSPHRLQPVSPSPLRHAEGLVRPSQPHGRSLPGHPAPPGRHPPPRCHGFRPPEAAPSGPGPCRAAPRPRRHGERAGERAARAGAAMAGGGRGGTAAL